MGCNGCSVAATGATNPSLDDLRRGTIPAMPKVILHHPMFELESGQYVRALTAASDGTLGHPFFLVCEGSIADERLAQKTGGHFAAIGTEPVAIATWLQRLAPRAAVTIAIGTCATWGGVPAAVGNPTGSRGVMDALGKDYRSALGISVVNIPGCAPIGDNFTEMVLAVLLFMQGLGPLPASDELGRPAWLFGNFVHQGCTRAGHHEEGSFAGTYGAPECLAEIGCWGPLVKCNIGERGAINHMGGCMNVGGACVGCTMPGFPDKFSPFLTTPAGARVATTASRGTGAVIRRLRIVRSRDLDREVRWDTDDVPSGWVRSQGTR
jgi:hydrogenase small subunit